MIHNVKYVFFYRQVVDNKSSLFYNDRRLFEMNFCEQRREGDGLPLYNIGNLIKHRREELGLSQNELSEGICSVPTLSRIENVSLADAFQSAKGVLFLSIKQRQLLYLDLLLLRLFFNGVIISEKGSRVTREEVMPDINADLIQKFLPVGSAISGVFTRLKNRLSTKQLAWSLHHPLPFCLAAQVIKYQSIWR